MSVVKMLKLYGENVQLRQDQDLGAHNLWAVILSHQWQAALYHGGKTYHAPWTLRRLGTESKYLNEFRKVNGLRLIVAAVLMIRHEKWCR